MTVTVGQIKRAREIGFKGNPSGSYMWLACDSCGKERWVQLLKGQPKYSRCNSCKMQLRSGKNNPVWNGGSWRDKGYVIVYVSDNDFFFPMATHRSNYGGYVFEHRLVVAKTFGRCLHSWEIVHHKNGIRDDNRVENLQLVSDDRHKQITILENRIEHLESRVTTLEAENILLKQSLQLEITHGQRN